MRSCRSKKGQRTGNMWRDHRTIQGGNMWAAGRLVGHTFAGSPNAHCGSAHFTLLLLAVRPKYIMPARKEATIHWAGRLRVDNGLTSHEYLHLTASPSCTLSSSATYPKAYGRENKAPARSHKTTWTHFGRTVCRQPVGSSSLFRLSTKGCN